MNKNGPIIVIEDDMEDQEIFTEIFKDLNYKNEVIFFSDGNEALDFLNDTNLKPFLILSDINMPKMNGFEVKNKIATNKKLETKCIPYLFLTTGANKNSVLEAYSLSVQGFFMKPNNLKAFRDTIKKIVDYWQECIAPSEFE